MKVLHICEAYGGGVKKHLDLISEFMDKDIENFFYISAPDNESVNIKSNNVYVDKGFSNRKNPSNLLNSAKEIIKRINEIKPQVIHFHSTFAGVIAIIIKPFIKKQKIKFIYTPHAYYSQRI